MIVSMNQKTLIVEITISFFLHHISETESTEPTGSTLHAGLRNFFKTSIDPPWLVKGKSKLLITDNPKGSSPIKKVENSLKSIHSSPQCSATSGGGHQIGVGGT
jgi:hypothetical protein